MDIRTYFKGDGTSPPPKPPPTTPKSPPRPTVLELPEFLFISAGTGVKRNRSTIAENVDDIDNSDNFNTNLHRVLSPLEVRVVAPTTTKPSTENVPNTTTTKRKKSKSNKDDGIYFTDDLEDRLAMLAAHKERTNKEKEETENKKKKTKSKDSEKKLEQLKIKSTNPHHKPSPSEQPKTSSINSKSSHATNHTTSPVVTTPKPPQPISPISQNNKPNTPSSNTTAVSKPIKKVVVVDLVLEQKIKEKMEAVQLYQNKCTELRKQLSHATTQLSQSLDELDHLNSLFEESNN